MFRPTGTPVPGKKIILQKQNIIAVKCLFASLYKLSVQLKKTGGYARFEVSTPMAMAGMSGRVVC
jgi:hypothetical protein